MQKIYTDLSLDFQSGRSLTAAHVTQGDKSGGRVLRIALYNGGQRVDLNSETDTVSLLASVGNTITAAGHSLTITDNMVRVPIMDELTQLSGVEHCTVRVESTNGRVHTARFDLIVDRSPISPDMPEIIATADLVDRVDAIETTSHDFVKNYLLSSFRTVHPEYTYVLRRNTEVQGGAGTHFCLIPKSIFDPAVDGIMIWTDLYLILDYLYEFDTISDPDNVIVNFVQSADFYIDGNNNKVDIHIYQKSPTAPQTYGISAVYAPMAINASVLGTTLTDLSPRLAGNNDGSHSARSSVSLGRLCTNIGGVVVVYVMHRATVNITGDSGTWSHTEVAHGTIYDPEDVSYSYHGITVFWRVIAANEPISISVTADSSENLFAAAYIYEGKSAVSLISSANNYHYNMDVGDNNFDKLYYNNTDETWGWSNAKVGGGIDVWFLTTETVVANWVSPLDTAYDPTDENVSHPDSGTTNRLTITGGQESPLYVDDQGQCKSYLGFYVKVDKLISQYQGENYYTYVQYMHLLIS